MPTATLLVSCPDQKGLVAKLSNFIYSYGGNILHADHHTDLEAGLFLSRIEWDLEGFRLERSEIVPAFSGIARGIQANWELHFSDTRRRIAVWVSKQPHCLLDLIWRQRAGELLAEIPLIISNHPDLEPLARSFGIDYYHIPVSPENKAEAEARQLALLQEYRIDLVVLAKYMQVLSGWLLRQAPPVINIHHSTLPAFAGANPYQRAHQRGVKIIGATAHYATEELDEGPIIEQDVVRVSHRDTVADLIRKGRDMERLVLARAVRYHLENRVLVYHNKTVVFA
ncbi:formyltetrahydrofolate deformylase [Thermostichus sp. MS-CIW-19]|jgi:formyltetrahydrofolate deformylase|uniref:formyltetrahydrofolate deformylase n=1 Tax=unclassified Synechococcus TaxID=2626047 RepID=UPI000C17AA65|nr:MULTISPECIES: formyltetrahydrofolate deformylase [unclassified Synechococcus]PIK94704.1 formyltetrahydrofolate deformylase [Synechococcus sp. 60AY4M2]PIK96959.1 formyltetrahydrofolate deformylase [Synechococcus sp. 63AY4M1]PIL00968.1 formyltetrahydrofolate deformylase [Synechococcus sp. 65AY640]